MGLHAKVETQQKVCEVHADAKAVSRRYLLVELIEAELAPGLVHIVFDCPYISGIDKQSALKNPEELGAVLQA